MKLVKKIQFSKLFSNKYVENCKIYAIILKKTNERIENNEKRKRSK